LAAESIWSAGQFAEHTNLAAFCAVYEKLTCQTREINIIFQTAAKFDIIISQGNTGSNVN
jgi:hypothetical protein